MYFPYIRAKQFDIDAITEIDNSFYKNDQIVPIVEPVSVGTKKSQFARLAENNVPFILVVNPIVGDYQSVKPNKEIVSGLVNDVFKDYKNYWLGYIIHPATTLKDIQDFITAFPVNAHTYIHHHQFHDGAAIAQQIAKDKNVQYNIFIDGHASIKFINEFNIVNAYDILIKDGFKKRKRNEDYPANDYFYDLHKTYSKDLGYDGFGDYTIVGSQYEPGGGPAYVVALHISDKDDDDNIVVKHFKSDAAVPPSAADPGGKFKQALKRAKKHFDLNPHLDTSGVDEYIALHRSGHYPGLGMAKKHSIKHHIEFISKYL